MKFRQLDKKLTPCFLDAGNVGGLAIVDRHDLVSH
jgi:hypothetical protein